MHKFNLMLNFKLGVDILLSADCRDRGRRVNDDECTGDHIE